MPGTPGPNLGLTWGWAAREVGWGLGGYNPGFAMIDTLLNLAVTSITNTPPASPANGDRYIVGTAPTGAWAGQPNKVAVYLTTGTPGWVFYTPKRGWQGFNVATGSYWYFDGTNWLGTNPGSLPPIGNTGDLLTVVGGAAVWQGAHYGVAFSAPQTTAYAASQVIGHHPLSAGVTFPANFGTYLGRTSKAGGTANATASTIISVDKAGAGTPNTFSQIGTITIAAGGIAPTFATSGGAAVVGSAGDVLRIVMPATPDLTFAGFYCNLAGHQ